MNVWFDSVSTYIIAYISSIHLIYIYIYTCVMKLMRHFDVIFYTNYISFSAWTSAIQSDLVLSQYNMTYSYSRFKIYSNSRVKIGLNYPTQYHVVRSLLCGTVHVFLICTEIVALYQNNRFVFVKIARQSCSYTRQCKWILAYGTLSLRN